jgi:hypothetical protein
VPRVATEMGVRIAAERYSAKSGASENTPVQAREPAGGPTDFTLSDQKWVNPATIGDGQVECWALDAGTQPTNLRLDNRSARKHTSTVWCNGGNTRTG